jgi:hypothetical protein
VSLDGGKQWAQFTANLPNVAVRDLAIHPREHDLLIATHGRGIYIVDDLTPLRNLTTQALESDVAFLAGRPSALLPLVTEFGFNGDAEFLGTSPGDGAVITYYLKKRHMIGDLKLEVYDAQGTLLTTIAGGKRRGINRVEWTTRSRAPRTPPGAGIIQSRGALVGPRALPGTYTVKMIKGKDTYTSSVTTVPDPASSFTAEDRLAQRQTALKLYGMVERLAYLVDAIVDARGQARGAAAAVPAKDPLRKRLDALVATFEQQRMALVSSQRGEGISGEEKLREELGMLYGNVNTFDGRPTPSQIDRMGVLEAQLTAALSTFTGTFMKEVASVDALTAKQKIAAMTMLTPDGWEKRRPQ